MNTEDQQIEYKATWRDEYLKWICGFANAQGGTLVIGRADDGKAVGINNAAELLERLPNQVRDLLGIVVDIQRQYEDGHELLAIRVEPYPTPISYKGQYHYRSGSTKQELKGAALDRFLLRKQGRHWDGVPVPYLKPKDLDPQALALFRQKAERAQRLSPADLSSPDTALLKRLHLYENKYLKRAAALLFHPDPEAFVTGAYIKVGYFASESEILYHDEIHGPLLVQVEQALDLIWLKYLKGWISYDGLQRVETYPVPRSALREALLNAVIHKDYGSGAPIQIRVYYHKLTVGNASVLPEDWQVEDLTREHESRPFNPDIAHVFFRAGEIESWGRGVEKILNACTEAGFPLPSYHDTGATLRLSFPFAPEIIALEQGKNDGINEEINGGINEEIKLTPTDQHILEALKQQQDLTISDLMNVTGRAHSTVERSLSKLQQAGWVQRVGSRKTGYWKVHKP